MSDANSLNIRLKLQPHGFVKTELIPAEGRQRIVVRASNDGELAPAIFIYSASGSLVAKNDEESGDATFEWRVPVSGSYRIAIYSNADTEVEYNIVRLPALEVRGPESSEPPYAVRLVFWGTNRAVTSRRPVMLATELAQDHSVSYGVSKVSIPRDHRMGNLEGPSIFRLEFRSDPGKHIAVLDSEVVRAARFFSDLSSSAQRTGEKSALLFVHGFNTSFEDAVKRTAQISYDLGFNGPAVLFSWPSQGELGVISYNKDRRNAELSVQTLRDFIAQVADQAGVQKIHIIAHSMGTFALVRALAESEPSKSKIGQVALLAPDIDAESFRQLSRTFPKAAARVALYASSRDGALIASERFEGYPRAGQGQPNLVVVQGVDTIDASSADTSLLGVNHSYYADSSHVLSDLFSFLQGNSPERRFGLRPAQSPAGAYWIFSPVAR